MRGDVEDRSPQREGETAREKKPCSSSQEPWVIVGGNRRDLFLERSPLVAPEVSCRRRPRVFCQFAEDQALKLWSSSRDVVGGCRPSDLRDQAGTACLLGPPLHRSSVEPPLPQSVIGPSLWEFLNLLSTSMPYFPTVRAGASNPGDGSRSSFSDAAKARQPYDLLPPCEKAPR